jgi:hypothetical protein
MRVNRGLRRRFCDILMNLYRSFQGSNEQMLISYSFNAMALEHIVIFSKNFSGYTAVSSRPTCASIRHRHGMPWPIRTNRSILRVDLSAASIGF